MTKTKQQRYVDRQHVKKAHVECLPKKGFRSNAKCFLTLGVPGNNRCQ